MNALHSNRFEANDLVTVTFELAGEAHLFSGFFVAMDETGVLLRAKPDRNVGFTFFPMARVVKLDAPA